MKIFPINLSKPIFYSSFTEIKYRLLLFQPAIQMDLLDFLFQFIKNNFSNTCFSQVLLKHIYIFSFNIYFTSVLLSVESALIMLRYLQVRSLLQESSFQIPCTGSFRYQEEVLRKSLTQPYQGFGQPPIIESVIMIPLAFRKRKVMSELLVGFQGALFNCQGSTKEHSKTSFNY